MRFRRNRLVALVAAIALIAAASVYSAHGLGDRMHDDVHCGVCLQFSGTAGPHAHASVVSTPMLVVRAPVRRAQSILPARRRVGTNLPRGPPVLELI